MTSTTYPLPVDVPDALRQRDQWVVWRYERDTDGKDQKIPYQVTGQRAKSNDPTTWTSYDRALRCATLYDLGLNFAFSSADPFVGVDLDDCVDNDGAIAPWALEIIKNLDSYAEISPSGHGVKVWCEGAIPSAATGRPPGVPDDEPGKIELYDQGRFFTLTGQTIGGMPFDVRPANGALTALYAALKPARAAAAADPTDPLFNPGEQAKGGAYMQAAIAGELATLAQATEPGRNTALNTAAFNLSRFVAAGLLDRAVLEAMLLGAARATGLQDAEIRRTVASGIDAGLEKHPAAAPTNSAPDAGAAPQPSKILHASALHTLPPTKWLIDGVIGTNKLSQIFGPPGAGKSFIGLDQALCIAQHAPVLYVCGEAIEDYEARVAAWCDHNHLGTGLLFFWTEPVQLSDRKAIAAFIDTARLIVPVAIFVDPLASCMCELDENATGDMTIAVDAINRIRRATGAGLQIIHHTGWADSHERGSSVLRAACRVVLKLDQNADGLISLSYEKVNNFKANRAWHFRLVPAGASVVPVPSNRMALRNAPLAKTHGQVLDALYLVQFRDGATHTAIKAATNLGDSTVASAIDKLLRLDYAEQVGQGRGRLIKLTFKGTEEAKARLADQGDADDPLFHKVSEEELNWIVNLDAITSQRSSLMSPHQDAVLHSSSLELHSENEELLSTTSLPPSLEGGVSEEEEVAMKEEPDDPGVPLTQIHPKSVAYSAGRVQELIDNGMSRADAIDVAAAEARAGEAQP